MTPRAFRRDERGVAAVLGAVLVTSLLLMLAVSVRVSHVPAWQARQEGQHMRQVEEQMLTLKAALDRQVENRSAVPMTHPVTLGVPKLPVFGTARAPDQLRFEPGNHAVTVSASRLLMQERNDTGLFAAEEVWVDPGAEDEVENITAVQSFRLRVEEVSAEHDGEQVLFEVRDSSGAFRGDFQALVENPAGPNVHVNVRVRDADSEPLYDQPEATFQSTAVSPYWIDVLEPKYRFRAVLGAADPPFAVDFAVRTLAAEYAITYLTSDAESGGSVLAGGGGVVVDDYLRTYLGGALHFTSRNSNFVDQTFRVENGAMIVEQNEGAALKVPPGFIAGMVGNKTSLALTVPSLVGNGATLMGQGTATVRTLRLDRESLVASAPMLEVNVSSDDPGLWRAYWRAELRDAGLVEGPPGVGEFNLTAGSGWARVAVYGRSVNPASTYYDLFVTIRQVSVEVELHA